MESNIANLGDKSQLKLMLEDYSLNKLVKMDQLEGLRFTGGKGKNSQIMSPSDLGAISPNMKRNILSGNSANDSKGRIGDFSGLQLDELEEKILGLPEVLETKIDKSALESILSSKVDKEELIEMLPD